MFCISYERSLHILYFSLTLPSFFRLFVVTHGLDFPQGGPLLSLVVQY